MITFGDVNDFAINYQPCPESYNYDHTSKMAICHLVINDNLIGRSTEECYLPTWLFNLTDRKKRIIDTKDFLFPKEFEDLTDREIFEIILKANQLEEEFDPDFFYLPQLDDKLWSRHSFTIDETIDSYVCFFYIRDGQIMFLIENNNGILESDYRSYKFIFHSVDLNYFINIIDQATIFLTQQYPYLKENISSRTFNSG